jgi:hypothetical protein
MEMKYNHIYEELARDGLVFKELLFGISEAQYLWKVNTK